MLSASRGMSKGRLSSKRHSPLSIAKATPNWTVCMLLLQSSTAVPTGRVSARLAFSPCRALKHKDGPWHRKQQSTASICTMRRIQALWCPAGAGSYPRRFHARQQVPFQLHAAQAEELEASGATVSLPWEGDVLPFKPLRADRVEAGEGQCPVVILPGFGNNTEDYVAPFGEADQSLKAVLEARGFAVFVVELERKDWLKVARALLSWRFYNKTCTADPGYRWYLDLIASKVDEVLEATEADKVDLVGHSAGGWLARAFVADSRYFDEVNPVVRRLVTLGAPHFPPPDRSKDMTGGTLGWVSENFPGTWLKANGIECTCVCGRSIRGNSQAEKKTLPRYSFGSYEMVCGVGQGTEGDCIIPLDSAFMESCEQITLNGVLHSMSRIGTYGEKAERPWYGSESVVDGWLGVLVTSEAAQSAADSK